jgi:hypothetical protein
MRKLKQTFKVPGNAIILIFTIILKTSFSQIPINPGVFGQNAWFISVNSNTATPPSELDGKYKTIAQSGVKYVRIGGIDPNWFLLYSLHSNNVINKVNNLKRLIDSLRAHSMEPIIQVGYYPASLGCSGGSALGSSSPLFGKNLSTQALIAANLVKRLNDTVYPTRPILNWIIGNEPDLGVDCSSPFGGYGWDGNSMSVQATADSIAKYLKTFSKAMKNADNRIRIIGPELAAFGTDRMYWKPAALMDSLITDTTKSYSIMGKIYSPGNQGHGKYYVDVISYHTYPNETVRDSVINNPRINKDGFGKKLSIPGVSGRKGIVQMISEPLVYRNISNTKIAVTEFNLGNQDTTNESTEYNYMVGGVGCRSFLGGQWLADAFSQGLNTSSLNQCWVDFMMPWSVKEGGDFDGFGYLSSSTSFPNRKRSAYWHYHLMANNFRGNFFMGESSNDSRVKAFSSQSCDQIAVMLLNQNTSSKTIDINFASTYPGGSNVKVRLHIGASWSNYNLVMGAQETVLLIFDPCGTLKRKYVYSVSNCLNNQPPDETLYMGPLFCTCRKLKQFDFPNYTLRCANSGESGSNHFNSVTLTGNVRMRDSVYVTGTLVVPSGKVLTIDTADVMFGSGAQIEVQSGGKLIVTGSNLHSCEGSRWLGLSINGNNAADQFTITTSRLADAVNGVIADNTDNVLINGTVFENCTTGVVVKTVDAFTITNNEFISLQTCVKTASCMNNASEIKENLFYAADTCLLFKDDNHSSLNIFCNGFIDYEKFGIHSTNTTLKDQGNAGTGAGNRFISISSETNHELTHTGGNLMNYYYDPSYPISLSTSSPYRATAIDGGSDRSCTEIEGRLVNLANIVKGPQTADKIFSSVLISCVPNPSSGKNTFIFRLADDAHSPEIRITNLYGQVIKSYQLSPGSKSIEADLSNLDNGIYFYSLFANGQYADSKKIVLAK